MAKQSMNYWRIVCVACCVVLLGGGFLVCDSQVDNTSAQSIDTTSKTPASQLTVKIVPLIVGDGANDVIVCEDENQQAWAKRLVSDDELHVLIDSLGEAFPFDYQIGDAKVVPDECFVFKRGQYDADKVQFWLVGQREEADYLTLGMLPAYMYADNGAWLSGRARLGNPVAIMSSWRMGLRIADDDPRLLTRWHTLVRHELGHTLGLHHNESRKSLMFGGKSLEDLDAQSTELTEADWKRLDEICPVEWE